MTMEFWQLRMDGLSDEQPRYRLATYNWSQHAMRSGTVQDSREFWLRTLTENPGSELKPLITTGGRVDWSVRHGEA